jgi:hypothetical protein
MGKDHGSKQNHGNINPFLSLRLVPCEQEELDDVMLAC